MINLAAVPRRLQAETMICCPPRIAAGRPVDVSQVASGCGNIQLEAGEAPCSEKRREDDTLPERILFPQPYPRCGRPALRKDASERMLA